MTINYETGIIQFDNYEFNYLIYDYEKYILIDNIENYINCNHNTILLLLIT